MDLFTFVKLAKEYRDLGTAVQDQFDDILEDFDSRTVKAQNPHAVQLIEKLLIKIGNIHDPDTDIDCADLLSVIVEARKTNL